MWFGIVVIVIVAFTVIETIMNIVRILIRVLAQYIFASRLAGRCHRLTSIKNGINHNCKQNRNNHEIFQLLGLLHCLVYQA